MGKQAIEVFRACIPLFQALGDPTRQDIILTLAETEPLSVNEIADKSALSRPAISHHLKILRDVNMVKTAHNGTQRYYSLALGDAVSLLRTLVETVEEKL